MTTYSPQLTATERLRASPNFVQAFTLDGRPYIAKETEPYIQFWLTERYRILLSLFSSRHGTSVEEVTDNYFRLKQTESNEAECKRIHKAITDMRQAGVLIDPHDDTSRYNARIVNDYVIHRPFPRALSQHIIQQADIHSASQVLDLAGGPGDLALMLAQVSNHVSLMELSKGFLRAATKRAKNLGVNLIPLHESCNRLVFQEEEYDVITIAQALHWLDDILVCRGVCRLLRPNGSFFVIHSVIELDDQHPLAYILGYDSILGKKERIPFTTEVEPLLKRLTLLFDALDAPNVQRIDPTQRWNNSGTEASQKIVPINVSFFRQRRPIEIGYARGFLTPNHIKTTGQSPEIFWKNLETKCANATSEQLIGTHHWSIMHFRRGGIQMMPGSLEFHALHDIDFTIGPVV